MREALATLRGVLVVSLLFHAAHAAAQEQTQVYQLNLAGSNDISLTVEPDTVARFRIVNRLPAGDYRIRVSRSVIRPPALDRSLLQATLTDRSCQQLADGISGAETEEDLGRAVRAAEAGLEACMGADRTGVMNAIRSTRTEVQASYPVSGRDRVTLVVERLAAEDGNDEIEETWQLSLSGGGPGRWSVRYGFNFIPNQDERFFSAESGDAPGTYVITRQAEREELDFAPSVFFAWRSAERARRGGPVFGLGFDPDEPLVFGGWGFDFGDNVTVALGGVFHKQSRLAGRYSAGEQIATNLDEGQLLEDTYDLNGFIGIAFRFDSNPFGDDSDSE